MDLQIAGTNLDVTPQMRQYVERKLGKLKRYLTGAADARIELSEEKTKSTETRYVVRVTADSKGAVFHGEERGADIFTAIDKLAPVIARQMEEHKKKLVAQRRSSPSFARTRLGEEAALAARKVVKTKHFVMEPISVSEAIEQMETLGHDFFLFLDSATGGLQLVYRRNDNNYGLIIPEVKTGPQPR